MSSETRVPEWLTAQEFGRIAMYEITEKFELAMQEFLTRNESPWMVDGRVAIHPIAVQPETKYRFADLVSFCHTIEAMQEDYEWLRKL